MEKGTAGADDTVTAQRTAPTMSEAQVLERVIDKVRRFFVRWN